MQWKTGRWSDIDGVKLPDIVISTLTGQEKLEARVLMGGEEGGVGWGGCSYFKKSTLLIPEKKTVFFSLIIF